jgi:CRP/FNR family transcriptional regulator
MGAIINMINEERKNELFDLYPVLSEVNRELLDHALSNAKVVTLSAGTLIFEELQPCYAFPFILSGNILVYKQSVNGRELSLYSVTSGDACVVTAGCLLGDEPYNASKVGQTLSLLITSTRQVYKDVSPGVG